jgi:hypothetical protein
MPLPLSPLERRMTREFFDPATTLNDMKRLSGRGDLATLASEAQRRGYKAGGTQKDVLGYRQRVEAAQPMRPPRGIRGTAVREVEFELRIQAFTKDQSQDQAALITTTLRAGRNTETYEALLEAPGGDFARASEHVVEGGKVVATNSWWSAFTRCLHSKCVSVCVSSLLTCPFTTWVGYVGCVLARCGGCGAKCAACASCDCRWWCRWAAGCCDA